MRIIERPTEAIINLNALRHNYEVIRKASGASEIMAVIKANAYGHGDVEVAQALRRNGVRHFGVALVEEGMRLRKGEIMENIYILSGVSAGQEEEIIKFGFVPLISDIETAERFGRAAKKLRKSAEIHLKIDTGMGRLGLLPWEADAFFKRIKKMANLNVTGIASHFADLADGGREFAEEQLKTFNKVIALGINNGFRFRWIHIANSAAVFLLPEARFNMVRPGIALYGYSPSSDLKLDLKPVMELKTRIIHIKRVPKGFSISYGRTFITRKESLIATIPIGYADGMNRLMSNKGEVLVRGKRVPVAGRVCMDLTMIDVTGVDKVKVGDEVVIIGRQGRESITALEIANKIGTISYEILTSVSSRVPRRYVK